MNPQRVAAASASFASILTTYPWLGPVIGVGNPPLTRLGCFTGKSWRTMAKGLPDSALELLVVDLVNNRCPAVPGSDFDTFRFIDRTLLATLSAGARTSDDDLVRLWVATMIWGHVGDNRGPGKIGTALDTTYSAAVKRLRDSMKLLDAGNVVDAYRYCLRRGACYFPGIGRSFFTKWLWSAALGATIAPMPLVLDDNAASAAASLGTAWSFCGKNEALRYVDYCELAEAVGADLTPALGHIDAEKIEYALYCVG